MLLLSSHRHTKKFLNENSAKLWYARVLSCGNFPSFTEHNKLRQILIHSENQKRELEILFSHRNENNDTPFHIAVRKGKRNIVQALLKLYPEGVNLKGSDDNTPIMEAILTRNFNMVKLLHENQADLNRVKNKLGYTGSQMALLEYEKNPQDNLIFDYLLVGSDVVHFPGLNCNTSPTMFKEEHIMQGVLFTIVNNAKSPGTVSYCTK